MALLRLDGVRRGLATVEVVGEVRAVLQPDDPSDFAEPRTDVEDVRLAFAGTPAQGEWVLAADGGDGPQTYLRFGLPPLIE